MVGRVTTLTRALGWLRVVARAGTYIAGCKPRQKEAEAEDLESEVARAGSRLLLGKTIKSFEHFAAQCAFGVAAIGYVAQADGERDEVTMFRRGAHLFEPLDEVALLSFAAF